MRGESLPLSQADFFHAHRHLHAKCGEMTLNSIIALPIPLLTTSAARVSKDSVSMPCGPSATSCGSRRSASSPLVALPQHLDAGAFSQKGKPLGQAKRYLVVRQDEMVVYPWTEAGRRHSALARH